ncbi:hypothetical protein SISNIDRAFT_450308 [Sistotremastrum niveocremeum HHB9708]|uniref:Uncharacterized protein n=1 Tax=Sistotremastrum niveocremeum HHB9708 TaxID=1314777 RepID=A0A164Y5F3_9AGAM|nr:hypothetical protein SISNIDRAFT_450308 [Sistotremastrum niveocremeum HHB9708]
MDGSVLKLNQSTTIKFIYALIDSIARQAFYFSSSDPSQPQSQESLRCYMHRQTPDAAQRQRIVDRAHRCGDRTCGRCENTALRGPASAESGSYCHSSPSMPSSPRFAAMLKKSHL